MSLETIRIDITTRCEALKSAFSGGYPLVVEYDNRDIVDMATQVNPFLQVSIKVLDGEQVSLSTNSAHRWSGVIALSAVVPCGSGTGKANTLLEHFYKGLHRNSFGSIRTFMAEPGGNKEHLGWLYVSALVPFWSDQPA